MVKIDKYIGKLRVVAEFCRETLQPIKDDTYIRCSKEGKIWRVDGRLLAYYRPSRGNSEQFCKKLIDKGVESVNNCSTDGDMLIQFAEDSLELMVDEVGIYTSGVNTNPCSIRNLRSHKWFKDNKQMYIDKGLYKELSEEEKEEFRKRFNNNVGQQGCYIRDI